MKKLVLMLAALLVAGAVMAGDGKTCNKGNVKTVELTGTIDCRDGATGDDCARVFRVADGGAQYSICDKSKAKLTSLGGSRVRISGKLVSCEDGDELLIDKAAKI